MDYLNIKLAILLIFTLFSCHCHEESSHKQPQKRSLKTRDASDNYVMQICSFMFDTPVERDENMKRRYYIQKLELTGRTIRFSDIPPANYCDGTILIIQILATEKIIIDRDYDSKGLDVTLVIAAPIVIVTGLERKIILKGYNGENHQEERAENGLPHGANGMEGNFGGQGGFFYGITSKLIWSLAMDKTRDDINFDHMTVLDDIKMTNISSFQTHGFYQYSTTARNTSSSNKEEYAVSLKIYVNGGNGGPGQNGGHGGFGQDGSKFDLSMDKMSFTGLVKDFEVILRKEVEPLRNETYLGKGVSEVILGKKATSGGNGGNAGPGGVGGQSGEHIFLFLTDEHCSLPKHPYVLKKGCNGYNGQDGKVGLGGPAGRPGVDIHLSIYAHQNRSIELRNVQYFTHSSSSPVTNGRSGVVSQRSFIPRRVPKLYSLSAAFNSYREFLEDHFSDTPIGRVQKKVYQLIETCCYLDCAK